MFGARVRRVAQNLDCNLSITRLARPESDLGFSLPLSKLFMMTRMDLTT